MNSFVSNTKLHLLTFYLRFLIYIVILITNKLFSLTHGWKAVQELEISI